MTTLRLAYQFARILYKADFRKARDVVLKRRMDLELILENSNSGFFTNEGIEIGTALHFVRDIQEWNKNVKSRWPSQGPVGGHSDDDYLQNQSMSGD
jgi:hypothetical protein